MTKMAANGGADPTQQGALTEDARRAIDTLRSRYPTTEALLLPALHIAQKQNRGWLPDAAINAVAQHLDLAPSKVYGVVTFYDLFHQQPVGHYRIRVCTNLSCTLRGANEILSTVRESLAVGEDQVTPDGRFSYCHFECLGACEQAPMMMINDEYHGNLTPEKARQLLSGIAESQE